MRIAIAQINPTVGSLEDNAGKIAEMYNQAQKTDAELVVCPELSLTGYPPRDLLESAHFLDLVADYTEKLAAKTGACGLIFGAPIREKSGSLFNSAIFAAEGKIQFTQHKMLLPAYDVFDENRYFTPGPAPGIIEFHDTKIGLLICEDSWTGPFAPPRGGYTRDPAEELAERKPELLINISASPFQMHKQRTRQKIAAYHNQKYAIPFLLVNQVGGNDELIFDGSSFYMANAESLTTLASFREDLQVIDTDNPQNTGPAPTEAVAEIHDALVLGIRDYMRKCGFKKAVIGLSGGIDSALTAALAVEALGREHITGITMPSEYSSSGSVDDSRLLAENLNIPLHTLPIRSIYNSFTETLQELFADTPFGVAEENLQARIRGSLLMAYSNKFGNLLLTTGNKSELSMGYATLYGDMNGGLAVLGDLLKTKAYELARYINRDQEIIPWNTINKPPSAELRPDQKDSDSLPPYETLDAILRGALEEGKSLPELIREGFDEAMLHKILTLLDRNEYKRRQAPPVLKVTGKAFGSGRRMPIAARIVR